MNRTAPAGPPGRLGDPDDYADYRCDECGALFPILARRYCEDHDLTVCPECWDDEHDCCGTLTAAETAALYASLADCTDGPAREALVARADAVRDAMAEDRLECVAPAV
jgi:hypothetical protein